MTDNQNPYIEKNDEISFKDLVLMFNNMLKYLKTKWLVICLLGVFGGLLGFTYAYFQKPVYTASLTFVLEDEKSGGGLTGALGLASSLGIDLGASAGSAFSGANLIELMMSRTLIEKALLNPIKLDGKTISLAEYYLDFTKLREEMNKKELLANIHYNINENRTNFSLQKDSLLGEIYQNIVKNFLTVSQKDKKVSIISIDVKTINESFSKSLTESVIKEVSEFYIETKSRKAKTNVSILQRQADSIRNELNAAISGVAQASDNVFNLNTALNIRRTPSTTRQVDVQANTAILTQLVTNLEMAKVTLLKETPLIQIIDKPILPLKKEKLSKLKSLILGGFLASFMGACFLVIVKKS